MKIHCKLPKFTQIPSSISIWISVQMLNAIGTIWQGIPKTKPYSIKMGPAKKRRKKDFFIVTKQETRSESTMRRTILYHWKASTRSLANDWTKAKPHQKEQNESRIRKRSAHGYGYLQVKIDFFRIVFKIIRLSMHFLRIFRIKMSKNPVNSKIKSTVLLFHCPNSRWWNPTDHSAEYQQRAVFGQWKVSMVYCVRSPIQTDGQPL